MRKLHLTRTIGFIIIALAVFGLYSFYLAFSDLGTASDSRLLARIGVPGFGIIVICAVLLTILSEMRDREFHLEYII